MENSFKFFENKQCEYYPCHNNLSEINCLFCYCPFYMWEECPGENKYIEKNDGRKLKNCTNCTFPHDIKNRDEIIKYLKMGKDEFYKRKNPIPIKFYGIGVGPGGELLLTKQAEKIIKAVDILFLPAKDKESCRAYNICEKSIPEIKGKECIFLPFPMSMKEPELSEFHLGAAKKIEKYLSEKKSVGFLSIGDVTIYSTFAYIEQIVSSDGYDTEYVSGIPSFCAASARLNTYLTLGNEEMHIIPGSADIDSALNLSGTIVFMKSGRRLKELKEKLLKLRDNNIKRDNALNTSFDVMAVSNCGMENEIISNNIESITEENGYLTVVIVKK